MRGEMALSDFMRRAHQGDTAVWHEADRSIAIIYVDPDGSTWRIQSSLSDRPNFVTGGCLRERYGAGRIVTAVGRQDRS